jgi:hypothetical protein
VHLLEDDLGSPLDLLVELGRAYGTPAELASVEAGGGSAERDLGGGLRRYKPRDRWHFVNDRRLIVS